MYIRYNEINKYYEYDVSGGAGVGPWLILPVDYAQIYNPPVIPPPVTIPPNIAFTDVANVFGPKQTINNDLNVSGNAAIAGYTLVTGPVRTEASYYERGRVAPVGHWVSPVFNAADYVGGAGTIFTVLPEHIHANIYSLVGQTLIWNLFIAGASLSGTPSISVSIKLPRPITPMFTGQTVGAVFFSAWEPALIGYSGGEYVTVHRMNVTNMPLGTVYISFQITLGFSDSLGVNVDV